MRYSAVVALAAGLTTAVLAAGLATVGGIGILAAEDGPEHPRVVDGGTVGHRDPSPLNDDERERAVATVMRRSELRAFGDPSLMAIESAVPWESPDGGRAGVVLLVRFPAPISGRFSFFADAEDSLAGGKGVGKHVLHELDVREMPGLVVRVDLRSGQIVEVSPADGTTIVGAQQAPALEGVSESGGRLR